MGKTLSLWFIALLAGFCLPGICSSQGNQLSPDEFLGPAPGYVFIYENPHARMIVHGLTWAKDDSLLVQQSSYSIAQSEQTAKYVHQNSKVYGLFIEGSRLLERGFFADVGTVDKIKIDLARPTWSNPITMVSKVGNTRKETPSTSKCQIINTSQEQLFGKTRTIIEIAGAFCPPRKYASGIGLINFNGLQLSRIEKQGKMVQQY